MKIFFRIVALNIIIGNIIAYFFPFSISKPVVEFQMMDWLSFTWILLSIMSGFFWIGYMFYHWGISKFKNGAIKRIWFWAMLFGGIPVYYIIVYEIGKGLKEGN